ncbi:MAG TPA: metal-dependent transcriptional regulator [Puia sp.]|nr:metal-dependent transcriptional regulator [Puia sp.]
MKYSASKENYLKTIYHLQLQYGTVSTNAVAEALLTRPASVTDMLKKLKQQKLLLYQRYKGFRLTQEGKKVAIQIIRKHRLWEYFLVEKLNFGWDEVHEMAEELEHISSKKLIDRLDTFLHFPHTDPHGDPIPDSQGKFNTLPGQSLLSMPVNRPALVSGIASQTAEMLELLRHKRIGIGTRVEIKKKFPFDNSIELKVRNQPVITLSEQVAKNILVKDES